MANSEIDKLKNTLGMGARANKYRVIINGDGKRFSFGEEADILCKSASIPSRSFAEIEIWNQGKLTVVAGDASYGDTWSVTFLDTEDHQMRTQFNEWMEFIDSVNTNARGANNHDEYMSTAVLQQLSTVDNSVTAEYTFYDIWPKNMSESALSDDSQELIEFSIEFNYTTWEKTQ